MCDSPNTALGEKAISGVTRISQYVFEPRFQPTFCLTFKCSITLHWRIRYDIKTNKCTSVWKCIIHTIYLLHVSATHVAISSEVHYKECVYRNFTDVNGTSAQV
jgi:hypothetical protein